MYISTLCQQGPREVVLWLSVHHNEKKALEIFQEKLHQQELEWESIYMFIVEVLRIPYFLITIINYNIHLLDLWIHVIVDLGDDPRQSNLVKFIIGLLCPCYHPNLGSSFPTLGSFFPSMDSSGALWTGPKLTCATLPPAPTHRTLSFGALAFPSQLKLTCHLHRTRPLKALDLLIQWTYPIMGM